MKKKCIDCGDKCFGVRCKQCSNRKLSLRRSLIDKVDVSTLTIDVDNYIARDKDGNIAPVKLKFGFKCILCNRLFQTSIISEKNKKHSWHCKSCAISLEWKDKTYHKTHSEAAIRSFSTDIAKKRLSEQSRRNWSDPDIKAKMLNKDHKAIAAKGLATKRDNLLTGKTVYKVTHGKRTKYNDIWMRSTYETRVAALLDSLKLKWKYEPKCFLVLNETKTYLPDFYVENYDVYVEVKGWWRDDAKEKFDDFVATYSQLRYSLITLVELTALETGGISFEDCIIKERR